MDNALEQNEKNESKSIIRIKKRNSDNITILPNKTQSDSSLKFEKELIELMLEGSEEIIEIILDHIHPDDFKDTILKQIATTVEKCYQNGNITTSAIIENIIIEETKTFALSLTLSEYIISDKWNKKKEDEDKIRLNHLQKTKDMVRKYRLSLITSQIENNYHRMLVEEDEELVVELLRENIELTLQRKMIIDGEGNSDLI